MNIIYFDIETQKSAEEVGGWNSISKMRMSVGVTYSTATGKYNIYCEEDVPLLIKELMRADLVVGFNMLRFDFEVLHGYTPIDLTQLPHLDLLVELYKVAQKKLSLDALATATLGVEKTSDGIQAIKWYREGKLLEIAEYCCYDVKITRMLHEYGKTNKRVYYFDRFGKKQAIPVNW
ncbi:MAG: ribonuclease H-like domain-containing protein [Verrucomicrobiae bacterium]|nr:ribonuclease H-like domain-containing protein [Verrucomicrobiae bacterium]